MSELMTQIYDQISQLTETEMDDLISYLQAKGQLIDLTLEFDHLAKPLLYP